MSYHDSTLLASDGGAYIMSALEEYLLVQWREEERTDRGWGFGEGQTAIAWIVKRLGPELRKDSGIVDAVLGKAYKYVESPNDGEDWGEMIETEVVSPLEDIKKMQAKGVRWDQGYDPTKEAEYEEDGADEIIGRTKWF